MKEFEEYLKRIGKSENTALTYCRNIRMYGDPSGFPD